MHHTPEPDRAAIAAIVIAGLEEVLAQSDTPPAEPVSEETSLIGRRSSLDSLGMVTLIVDLEQRIEEQYGAALTLASDRAMSQQSSPFRTVRTLTDYICTLLAEERVM